MNNFDENLPEETKDNEEFAEDTAPEEVVSHENVENDVPREPEGSDEPVPNEPVIKNGYIPRGTITVAAISLCALIAVAAVVVVFLRGGFKPKNYNQYNDMGYYNFSGRTVEEVASGLDMSFEEFVAEYELPSDMRPDTIEEAAYNLMPVRRVAMMYGQDFETLKMYFGFPDEVTEDMLFGEANDLVPLSTLYGDYLDSFKEEYGLGDDVTGETTWGEVRRVVQKKDYEEQIEAQKEAETQN